MSKYKNDFHYITEEELKEYSSELSNKTKWLVFNKCDSMSESDVDSRISSCLSELGREDLEVTKISSLSGLGTKDLLLSP